MKSPEHNSDSISAAKPPQVALSVPDRSAEVRWTTSMLTTLAKYLRSLMRLAILSGTDRATEDHVRLRFESHCRKSELVPDLTCFHPGEKLGSIRYIAYPHGLHVARWLKVLSHTQTTVAIDTANPVPAFSNEFVSACPALPAWMNWLRLPMTLRYFLTGFSLRWFAPRSSTGVVHAHCASGNGTVAWLSGRRYLIGTYGSEIYDAKNRGWLYCWLLKQILQGAERISVGSSESTRILCEEYDIPVERIYRFDLGYDEESFFPIEQSERARLRADQGFSADETIWVVNRRTDPHYRTTDVVKGFQQFCENGGRGRLVLLFGDHKPEYADEVKRLIAGSSFSDRMTIVDRILSSVELGSWLRISDFSISVPRTDNFSISTLESMACGTIPILAELEAYSPLKPCSAVRWMSRFQPGDFAAIFSDTATTWPMPHQAQRNQCVQFVQERFSTEIAFRQIAAFYLGNPLETAEIKRKAA